MTPELVLQGIQIAGHCGVSQEERDRPQPILIDLELQCFENSAGRTDQLDDTIDYAKVLDRVRATATSERFCLLETMAEHISQALLNEFPLRAITIWVRKTDPPLAHLSGSVGIRLHRSSDHRGSHDTAPAHPTLVGPPAPFLINHFHSLPKGTILDVATGFGRNALYLAKHGYSVHGLDRDPAAIAFLKEQAQRLQLPNLTVNLQDFEAGEADSLTLGRDLYDGIIVFFYLYRPLFPFLMKALKPGGVLIYETFLLDNHLIRRHPRRQEFCLGHNELLKLIEGLRVLYYDEGEHQDPGKLERAYTARLVARKGDSE